MKVVFKKIDPSVSDTLLTVHDTEFERFYPRINTNTEWAKWSTYIQQATRRYVLPFVSEAWYTILVDKHHAGTINSESEQTALELLQTAVAYYAAMYAYPKEMDLFSDAGNMVNSQMGGSTPTSLGIFKSKLWDLTLTADDHLDTLLAFLEDQVKLNNTAFNAFKTSTAFLRGKAELFRSTEEVQTYHNIGSSRRTYLSLLPYLRDAARLYVMPQIGQNMYDELVQQFTQNTLAPDNAVLLDYVRPALVKYALMCAADADGLSFEFDAPRVVSNPDGMDARQVMVANRLKNRLSQRTVFENIGKQYLTDVANFLKANLDKYPTFSAQMIKANDNVNASKIVVSRDESGRVVGGIGMF